MKSFVTYERGGGVSIDLNGYLRSPTGLAQLAKARELRALLKRQHEALRFPQRTGAEHD